MDEKLERREEAEAAKSKPTATPSVTDVEWTLTQQMNTEPRQRHVFSVRKQGDYARMCFKKKKKAHTEKNSDKSKDGHSQVNQ